MKLQRGKYEKVKLKIVLPISLGITTLIGATVTLVSCSETGIKNPENNPSDTPVVGDQTPPTGNVPTTKPDTPATPINPGDVEIQDAFACYTAYSNGYETLRNWATNYSAKEMVEFINKFTTIPTFLSCKSLPVSLNDVYQQSKAPIVPGVTVPPPPPWQQLYGKDAAKVVSVTSKGNIVTVVFDKEIISMQKAYSIGSLYGITISAAKENLSKEQAIARLNTTAKKCYEEAIKVLSLNKKTLTIICKS